MVVNLNTLIKLARKSHENAHNTNQFVFVRKGEFYDFAFGNILANGKKTIKTKSLKEAMNMYGDGKQVARTKSWKHICNLSA